ncbi:Protein srek1IP1 [Mortierella hygrophila]|uniref:Protein srek1IP1 n=1 Tax=Mortierella hygrophila TaxID=979708 RepID=A0A9P6K260_9FUNG|nr:Protein srek1IP1 [Mortierella hygrophila]
MAPGAKVQASKLSPKVTEAMIRALFEHIGPLDNIILIPSPLGAGYEAIIEFQEKDAALTATHLTGTIFGGRALAITQMDITLPATTANANAPRPFNNMTMQQQQAQNAINGSSGVTQHQQQQQGNPIIRMGATIHHPQFGHPMGGMGNQYPPMYPNPHMTLYNPNIMPPQYHQQQQLHQQRLLEQANDPSKSESKTVYVGNLPLTVTKEQLEEVFRDCGVVTRVNITGKATHPTRFAFMDFDTVEAARKALASTDKVIGDRTLRINPPKHSGPLPYMIQHAQMMQSPSMMQPQPSQPTALDATRTRYKNILIKLINRGGDPSLLKKLEELEAGGPLPDMSGITGLSPDLAALNNDTASPSAEQPAAAAAAGPPQTAASLLEKLVSSSRRRSRSPSRSRSSALTSSRRRSRSRSADRDDYYKRSGSSSRRSRRRSHSRSRSPSRSRYTSSSHRSSRAHDVDDRERDRERERGDRERYESSSSSSRRRERDEPSRSSRSSRGHAESSRPRDRDRERERERDRDRERHRE